MRRLGYLVGLLLIASGLFHLVVFAVDGGSWEGPLSWRKPVTFGLSFGITLITVLWVTSYLRGVGNVLLGLFIADCVLEVAGITVQTWRGQESHFNRESAVDGAIATMLGVGGVILVVVLVAFARQAFKPLEVQPGMRIALRAGFVTMLIALVSGAAMIARGVIAANTVGQEAAYQVGGFLKPLHGVSMHGLLVLPALAWLLDHFGYRRTWPIWAATAAYAMAIAAALVYSLISATG